MINGDKHIHKRLYLLGVEHLAHEVPGKSPSGTGTRNVVKLGRNVYHTLPGERFPSWTRINQQGPQRVLVSGSRSATVSKRSPAQWAQDLVKAWLGCYDGSKRGVIEKVWSLGFGIRPWSDGSAYADEAQCCCHEGSSMSFTVPLGYRGHRPPMRQMVGHLVADP